MCNIKKTKKGFTLMELIISIFILEIIIVPIFSIVYANTKTTKKTSDRQSAIYLCQKYIEEFKTKENISLSDNGKVKTSSDDSDVPKGLSVGLNISEKEEFKFGDIKVDNSGNSISYKKFSDIKHSGKVIFYKEEDKIYLDILSGNEELLKSKVLVSSKSSSLLEFESRDDFIRVNCAEGEIVLNKSIDSGEKLNSILILSKSGSNGQVNIKCKNSCTKTPLNVFIAAEEKGEVKFHNESISGEIKYFSNIVCSNKHYSNNSRVYQLIVEVKKDETVIEKATGYKTVSE